MFYNVPCFCCSFLLRTWALKYMTMERKVLHTAQITIGKANTKSLKSNEFRKLRKMLLWKKNGASSKIHYCFRILLLSHFCNWLGSAQYQRLLLLTIPWSPHSPKKPWLILTQQRLKAWKPPSLPGEYLWYPYVDLRSCQRMSLVQHTS